MKSTLFLFFLIFHNTAYAYTVLLDPGHGGTDLGAHFEFNGSMIYEKDLSLNLAKLIKGRLEKKHYRVFLTRSLDREVALEERAELAEKIKADLFISIHFNSGPLSNSHGFESYFLSNNREAAVKKVEDIENRGLKGEELVVHQILIDLIAEKTMESSKRVTTAIHHSIAEKTRAFGIANRGMKAGLFYVLALSKRPATLLEVGFVSNPDELKKITDQKFLDAYSVGVVNGIVKYFKELKKRPI